MTARVYVTLKKAVLDPQGKAVQRSLAPLEFPQARDVRVGRFVEIALEAPSKRIGKINGLLAPPRALTAR